MPTFELFEKAGTGDINALKALTTEYPALDYQEPTWKQTVLHLLLENYVSEVTSAHPKNKKQALTLIDKYSTAWEFILEKNKNARDKNKNKNISKIENGRKQTPLQAMAFFSANLRIEMRHLTKTQKKILLEMLLDINKHIDPNSLDDADAVVSLVLKLGT